MSQWHGEAPAQPPKKKHTGRNVFIVLSVLTVLGIGGCMAVVGAVGNEVDKQSKAEHTVIYKVGGSAALAMVTYTTDGGTTTEQANGVTMPWASKALKIKGLVTVYQVSAQNTSGKDGTVTCEIWVDDQKVKEATATGEAAMASCDHTP